VAGKEAQLEDDVESRTMSYAQTLAGIVGHWVAWTDGFGIRRRGKLCKLEVYEGAVSATVMENPLGRDSQTFIVWPDMKMEKG
jgi:hypothetical protein